MVGGSKAEECTNKLEFKWVFKCLSVEPVESIFRVVGEHAPVWIEKLLEDDLEVLFLDSALVDGRLILKDDPQWLPDLGSGYLPADKPIQTVFQKVVSSDFNAEVSCVND